MFLKRISVGLLAAIMLFSSVSCNRPQPTVTTNIASPPDSSFEMPSDYPDIYDVCAHQNTKRIKDQAATCTKDGYKNRAECKDCGAILDWSGEILPMIGHEYKDRVCKHCNQKEPSVVIEGDFEGSSVHWTIYDNGELSVTGSGAIPDMPEKENSYFYLYNKYIKKIVVHNGITEIGNYVFRTLKDATEISISASVKKIGNTSFEGWSLKDLYLPGRLVEIGEENFTGNQLFFLELPGTLRSVGKGSFSSAQMVTMRVPTSIVHFDVHDGQFSNLNTVAFMGSERMVSHLGLYKDLTESGECALVNLRFEYMDEAKKLPYCSKRGQKHDDFTYMIFTDDTARITKYSGSDEEITIPSKIGKYTVTGIEHNAFEENSVFKKVTLPETLTDIHAEAFLDSKLETLIVLGQTLRVGKGAFDGCTNFSTLTFDGVFTSVGAAAFADTKVKNIKLSENTTIIRKSAFVYSDIETFDFSNIEIIGESAFGQSLLKGQIDLSNVKEIRKAAFYNCSLTAVTLGKVNLIDKVAFYGNNTLEKNNVIGLEQAQNVHKEAFPF